MSKLTDWVKKATDDDLVDVIAGERPAGMPPQTRADTLLIAAAPDMLAELKRLQDVVGEEDASCIEAVIAKAEGESTE